MTAPTLSRHRIALERTATALERLRDLALEAGNEEDAQALLLEADRLRSSTFRVLVVGEFSRGKSTLINAMLGRRLLPARLRPTTSTLLRIRHGRCDAAEVVRDNGSVQPLPLDALGDATSVGGAASVGVREVRLQLDVPLLADGLEIVDTPGVNDLSTLREDLTLAHLPDADAAIFVLDAKACFTESERRFLASNVLTSNVARVFFVVNKLDQLDPPYNARDVEALRARVLAIVRPLVEAPRVFLLAARPALEGALSADPDLRSRSGLHDFLGALGQFLVEERGVARVERALRVAWARHSSVVEGLTLRAALLRERRDQSARMRLEQLERVSVVEAELARLRVDWRRTVEAQVAPVRERVVARAAALRRALEVPSELAGAEAALHQAFVDLAQRAVADLRTGIGAAAQAMAGQLDPERPALRWGPTESGRVDVSGLAPVAPGGPLVTTRSAMTAAGVMGAASLLGLFTPGVVLFAGLLAFLHVRSKEEVEEASGRARSVDLQAGVQEAARRLLATLDEEQRTLEPAAWAELAEPVTRRLASARSALESAESDLSRSERERAEAADALMALRGRLDAAFAALSDEAGAC